MNILKIAVFAALLASTTHAGVMPELIPQETLVTKITLDAAPEAVTGLDQL
ncbi:MAG: hypothetical protein ACPGNR_10275 [Paracoccaceae bacterium]